MQRNRQVGVDEIDIVAESPDGRVLACIEVKTSRSPGDLLDRVTGAKQRRLLRSARRLATRWPHHLVRIDVMTIELVPWRRARVCHLPNAVTASGPGSLRPRAGCGREPRAVVGGRGWRP